MCFHEKETSPEKEEVFFLLSRLVFEWVYEQTSKCNVLFLQQKYYTFSKELEDDISVFLSKFMEIVQQPHDQDKEISDSMITLANWLNGSLTLYRKAIVKLS